MPKFSAKNIEFKDNQQAIFGTDDDSYMSWDGSADQLVVSTTLSGVYPTEDGHLSTKEYVDDEISTISGILNELDTTSSGYDYINVFPGNMIAGAPPAPTYSTLGPITAYAFDSNKNETAYCGFSIPDDWKTDSSISISVCYMTSDSQTGVTACRWVASYHTYVRGDNYVSKTLTTYTLDSSLPSDVAAGYFMVDVFSSKMLYNDTSNPFEEGTTIMFMLQRNGKHANDTMSGDSALINVIFTYEKEAT